MSHNVPTFRTSHDEVLDYFTVEELSDNPEYLHRHSHFITEIDNYEGGKKKVIFLKEIGYQRKGMNRMFYTDFVCDKPYFDLESIKMAYKYLEGDHINTLEELQANFQRNFIDNFIEGESIFWVNW